MAVSGSATVYASAINAILQVAERFGVRREQLLSLDHLEESWLRNADDRLPVDRFFELYRLAAELTEKPDIGLYVGRVSYFHGVNLLLYMSTICNTFREYLNLVPSVLKLRGDIGVVKIERDGEFIRLEWHPLQSETQRERFLSDDVLCSSQAIVNSLCVDPIRVCKARFTYPRPADTTELERTFGPDLAFDEPVSCLYFERACLRSPVIKLAQALDENVASSLRDLFEDEHSRDPFLYSARKALASALPSGDFSIDHLATELGVSRRTLQRRLTDRHTHFMQLLAEVRAELAARYLSDKRLGITEIAFLLGYSDQAAFSTAFRSWFGMSPSEYRAS